MTESNHENSITKAFKYNDSISVLLSDPLCNFKSASKIDTIWQCLKLKKGNIISVIDSSGAYISPFLGGYFIGDAIVFKLYCFTGENNKPTYNSQLLADRDFVPVYLDISNETYADYYSKALDVMPTQSDEFDFADDGTVTDDYKEETYFLLYKIIEIDLKVMNDKKNRIEEDRIEYFIKK